MTNKRFAVFDSDSHVVEPPELWSKYLDPEFRTLGKFALWREEGKLGSYLKVNGKVFRDTMNSNIPRHAIWKPGMTWDKVGELDPDTRHAATAGASKTIAVAPEPRRRSSAWPIFIPGTSVMRLRKWAPSCRGAGFSSRAWNA